MIMLVQVRGWGHDLIDTKTAESCSSASGCSLLLKRSTICGGRNTNVFNSYKC